MLRVDEKANNEDHKHLDWTAAVCAAASLLRGEVSTTWAKVGRNIHVSHKISMGLVAVQIMMSPLRAQLPTGLGLVAWGFLEVRKRSLLAAA